MEVGAIISALLSKFSCDLCWLMFKLLLVLFVVVVVVVIHIVYACDYVAMLQSMLLLLLLLLVLTFYVASVVGKKVCCCLDVGLKDTESSNQRTQEEKVLSLCSKLKESHGTMIETIE